MKSIIYKSFFLLLMFSGCLPALSYAQIQIQQWLDKSEYVEGEPVFLFVKAQNASPRAVDFGLPSITTEIYVYDARGNRYHSNLTYNHVYVANLLPDSVYESFINIASNYGENAFGKPPHDFFSPCFKEGTYYVYLHWKDKGMEVTTPKIYFKVQKPNQMQQKIFEEFLRVLEIRQTRETRNEGRRLMKQLLEKYPDTIYSPTMYHLLWIYYSGERLAFELADQFIHKYPDHPYAGTSLIYVTKYFKRNTDKKGAIEYLTELKNEKLNQDLTRLIERNHLKRVRTLPIEDW